MRITIDTEAHDTAPVVSSTSSQTFAPVSNEGGSAPAAMQAAADLTALGDDTVAINAGPPSAELVAAIQAASPMMSTTQPTAGGVAPRL